MLKNVTRKGIKGGKTVGNNVYYSIIGNKLYSRVRAAKP